MNKWFLLILFTLANLSVEAQISDFGKINFEKADKKADSYKGNDLKNLPELAYNLTNDLPTDVEKFRAIYIWVSNNIANDYNAFLKNSLKRNKFQNDSLKLNNWNKTFSNEVFKKLLKEKKTVCTGYAYLIKKLANLADINCEIINGYGRIENSGEKEMQFPNHSWNGVQLNNKWYLCDATWSSGEFDVNNNTFEFNYNNGYFLTNPKWFAKNHFPIDDFWFLLKEKPIFSSFSNTPLLYGFAFFYNVYPIEPSIMFLEIEKNKEAVFILKALKNIGENSIYLEIVSGNFTKTIKPKVELLNDGLIRVKYTFTERGLFDVHFKIKNDIVCTYVVKVRK